MLVGEHLELDVARRFQILLHIHGVVAEGAAGLHARQRDGVEQARFAVHHPHAATAAAAGGLDDDRVADFARQAQAFLTVVAQWAVGTGYARHPGLLHGADGRNLVAHQADGFRARADENEAGLLDPFGKVGVFRQEAIARMDGDGIGDFRGTDQRRDIEIAFGATAARRCRRIRWPGAHA